MLKRTMKASEDAFLLLRPWLPGLVISVVVAHLFFGVMNIFSQETESLILRFFAILAIAPYIMTSFLERRGFSIWLQKALLPSLTITGPALLFGGLLLELSADEPNQLTILRRQYEFIATIVLLLIVSSDLVAALFLCIFFSSIVLAGFLFSTPTINTAILEPVWAAIMSSYILLLLGFVSAIAKKNTESRNKINALSEFGASIAHEIRTPLLSIKTRAQALLTYLPEIDQISSSLSKLEKRRKTLLRETPAAIIEEANSASTLIDIFLINSAPAPQSGIPTESFAFDDAITEAVTRYPYRSEAEKAVVTLDLQCPDTKASGPKILFTHIFFNLLKNSLNHLPFDSTSSIKLTSTIEHSVVTIKFFDNGPGIENSEVGKIFDPFYSRSNFYGTGIGLAFCKRTLENSFQGEITCKSELGKYTLFTIHVPVDTQ